MHQVSRGHQVNIMRARKYNDPLSFASLTTEPSDFRIPFCKKTAESRYDKSLVDCHAEATFDGGSCEATGVYNQMGSQNTYDRKGLSRDSVCQAINPSVNNLKS
jgi:hypothetical protein